MAPAPETLPPFREVNHRINIINSKAQYMERHPTCPQALEGQLREKLTRYERVLWRGLREPSPLIPFLLNANKIKYTTSAIHTSRGKFNNIIIINPIPNTNG